MPDHDAKEQLDDLLESLLSNYSAAAPKPGLETRILANLRRAQQRKRRFWTEPWFLGAATAAALVILVVAVFLMRLGQHSHPGPIQVRQPFTHPQREDTALQPRVGQKRLAARKPGSLTAVRDQDDEMHGLTVSNRPAIFPTPVPVSEQEGFMFLYLAITPKDELVAQGHRDETKEDAFWDDGSTSSPVPQQSGHIR
jgi:hypothetical protein